MTEKKHSYDEWWLSKDMENMGYIFEYCYKYCLELFNVPIDIKKFLNDFMSSVIRSKAEIGHPSLVSQSAIDTVEKFIKVDNSGDIEKYRIKTKNERYSDNQLYWVGWAYAYFHYRADITSKKLIKKLPLDFMLKEYKLAHEMDIEVYYLRHEKDLVT